MARQTLLKTEIANVMKPLTILLERLEKRRDNIAAKIDIFEDEMNQVDNILSTMSDVREALDRLK
jgi:hypothetical protein